MGTAATHGLTALRCYCKHRNLEEKQRGRKEGGNKGQERQVATPCPNRDKKGGWGLREPSQVPGGSHPEWTKQAEEKESICIGLSGQVEGSSKIPKEDTWKQ